MTSQAPTCTISKDLKKWEARNRKTQKKSSCIANTGMLKRCCRKTKKSQSNQTTSSPKQTNVQRQQTAWQHRLQLIELNGKEKRKRKRKGNGKGKTEEKSSCQVYTGELKRCCRKTKKSQSNQTTSRPRQANVQRQHSARRDKLRLVELLLKQVETKRNLLSWVETSWDKLQLVELRLKQAETEMPDTLLLEKLRSPKENGRPQETRQTNATNVAYCTTSTTKRKYPGKERNCERQRKHTRQALTNLRKQYQNAQPEKQ